MRNDRATFLWTPELAAQNDMQEITRDQVTGQEPLPSTRVIAESVDSEPEAGPDVGPEIEAVEPTEVSHETEPVADHGPTNRLGGRPRTKSTIDRLRTRPALMAYAITHFGYEMPPDLTVDGMRRQLKELESEREERVGTGR